jgi:hypothetical protein
MMSFTSYLPVVGDEIQSIGINVSETDEFKVVAESEDMVALTFRIRRTG